MMATGDRVYRTLLAATRFFKRGWGPLETYERYELTLRAAVILKLKAFVTADF